MQRRDRTGLAKQERTVESRPLPARRKPPTMNMRGLLVNYDGVASNGLKNKGVGMMHGGRDEWGR